MGIDPEAIAQIDATLLPKLDRHHVRLLAHCLDSFQTMDITAAGVIPDLGSRRRWCEQQPQVAEDPDFLNALLLQLNAAAQQLQSLADDLGKPPLELDLNDLIRAAEARCHHQQAAGRHDAP
ncbi:MAG: hypothetical protein CL861_02600 [Cyanobium sp. MED843]|nr:hypothetical protein [Cyanobium sp. MED843]OUW29892.1 MAG: hypothetical protein CBD37_02490 [Cyanobacteria bacterium TMED177]